MRISTRLRLIYNFRLLTDLNHDDILGLYSFRGNIGELVYLVKRDWSNMYIMQHSSPVSMQTLACRYIALQFLEAFHWDDFKPYSTARSTLSSVVSGTHVGSPPL